MLILPSGRQLRKYKNKVNQEPGLNDEVLNWMYVNGCKGKPVRGARVCR